MWLYLQIRGTNGYWKGDFYNTIKNIFEIKLAHIQADFSFII